MRGLVVVVVLASGCGSDAAAPARGPSAVSQPVERAEERPEPPRTPAGDRAPALEPVSAGPGVSIAEGTEVRPVLLVGGVAHVPLTEPEIEERPGAVFLERQRLERLWRAPSIELDASAVRVRLVSLGGHACDGLSGAPLALGRESSEVEGAPDVFEDEQSAPDPSSYRPAAPRYEVAWQAWAPVQGCPEGRPWALAVVGLAADAPRVRFVRAPTEERRALEALRGWARAQRVEGRLARGRDHAWREGDVTYVLVQRELRYPNDSDDETVWLEMRFGPGRDPECLGTRECEEPRDDAPTCRAWSPCAEVVITDRRRHDCPAEPAVGYADLDGDGIPERSEQYWAGLCDNGSEPAVAWYREEAGGRLRWIDAIP